MVDRVKHYKLQHHELDHDVNNDFKFNDFQYAIFNDNDQLFTDVLQQLSERTD